MIFQRFDMVSRIDVVPSVLHGKRNRHLTLTTLFTLCPAADAHQAIVIPDRLGIAEHADALPGAQQQRVAIALALAQDPQIVLADKPTASLDPMNAQLVMQSLRRIHEEGGWMVIAHLQTPTLPGAIGAA